MIPFNIFSFEPQYIRTLECLPFEINIHGLSYQLGGYTLHRNYHFTAVIFWRGKKYFYDSLPNNNSSRFVPFNVNKHLDTKEGSLFSLTKNI